MTLSILQRCKVESKESRNTKNEFCVENTCLLEHTVQLSGVTSIVSVVFYLPCILMVQQTVL